MPFGIKAKLCERGANTRQARRAESFNKQKKNPLRVLLKWRERRGRLDLFALNVPTDFLFRNFVSLKENAFALCSQVARTIKQGFALQSSRLFYSKFSTKKISPTSGLIFINGGNDEARTRDLMRDRHAL